MTAITHSDSFTGHPQFVLQPQKINSVKWPENLVLRPLTLTGDLLSDHTHEHVITC